MIQKSNIFNFASPDFIMTIVKKLHPMIAMPDDKIIRTGEIADEMYFIQKGSVKIVATDNTTKIAVLKEGSFFGEIGLLSESRRRTVTVISKTVCVI
mmetsp:Transcript_11523/g.9972  ORF Transcript_11523/g.9972 Transcript_11523/m.9972 type:complete len:97 (+) Transcript_11523:145-435(+)